MKKKLSLLMALSMGICSVQPLAFTATAEEEAPVKAIVRFYDSATNESIENLDVTVSLYGDSYYDENGTNRNVILDGWNTSNSNPHSIKTNDEFIAKNGDMIYYISTHLPNGYSYKNHNYFHSCSPGSNNISFIETASFDNGIVVFDIPIDHHPSVEEIVYPVKDSVTYSFDIIDKETNEPIEDVKVTFCELSSMYRMDKVKRVLSEWTYKHGDTIEIPFEFESRISFNYYGFKVEGLPENYVLEKFPKYENEYFISETCFAYNEAKYSNETPKITLYAVNKDSAASPVTTGGRTTATSDNSTTKTSQTTVINNLIGDANCDGNVNIADATAIMQHIGNPDKYALSEQGLKNADCYNTGDGITGMDALIIQKFEAKIIDELQ